MADRTLAVPLVILLTFIAASACAAQQPAQTPTPLRTPASTPALTPTSEEQEPVRVFTQEVRLPVVAYDVGGRFDPTLEPDDVLVLEDGIPQRVKSVRRIPASVLLVFDMGNQVAGTRDGVAVREAALRIVAALREGDRLAVVQNDGRVGVMLDWTTDLGAAARAVRTKFFSAPRSRLAECVNVASSKLSEQPVGNTHVIVFTSGLESQSRDSIRSDDIPRESLRRLAATQASVHVFGFAALVREFVRNRGSGGGIDLDFEMKRWFRNYARATKQREEQLRALARESGGRVLLPADAGEVVGLSEKVARDIGAQYVVTYSPRRPFDTAAGERRRAEAHSRRVGLQLFSLRDVVEAPAP
jgi:VWFA-related protein